MSGQRRETLSGSLWFVPLLMTLVALLLGGVLAEVKLPENGPLSPVCTTVALRMPGGSC